MRISMPKGDIHLVRFLIQNADGSVCETDFDEINFVVRKTPDGNTYYFKKTLTGGGITKIDTGDYQLRIEPEDTMDIPLNPIKPCLFYIQLCFEDEIKKTIHGEFVVVPGGIG